ncbi:MAG: D-glycero-beta-D-manno-heptose 1,7-bisphosphate 7-phosphatase [Gammaproteobacteria bacterium]|uniref:D-glycero-beta-D-manno-heptose 1,7-bisphosphate 7-phosphatase n=1 Tax=Limnobacter sp. TaxID=2003368 RepID=UPI001D69C066|nr:D-glycero-beta-D-manno-heptose 1,7-bisphosphate 7-phosphatase [Limnobacter sp.]MBU0783985.1 D-glycero-beta-D-manno-heptose 1,7-bisphosphate 7-phosphatase [Gammaproteobacteria bacterium]MBU0848881.1 D-glycero-beta-D-manno-heptose 1,7-bisphosphate 7-phosphatase [Gammaproteobacteria bacterium]MBU1267718.1 D-glycero-beta-D-manno-heptose 1,7-bisphosphate 7-phosphatase [Gammaproteobacteria bacterium]MBU1529482.1 D-glycero-beta-D-manno-heptose 1,7-bisphosphate 7-phosphatase [Gammaproteobacteria bac
MKLIVLDRDGVINEDSDEYIKSVDEWVPITGSMEAIARLNRGGFRVVVATNQSGISRGMFDLETLSAMHKKMHELAGVVGAHIEGIFFCPHGPDDKCNCRKPKSGLFQEIQARTGFDLNGVPCVGDSLRDLQAGASMGCTPLLVKTGKGKKTLEKSKDELPKGTLVFDNLMAVAEHLVPDDPFANNR